MDKGHYCRYCTKPLLGDYGYCCAEHAEAERGFIDDGTCGGCNSPKERRYIRAALKKWDAFVAMVGAAPGTRDTLVQLCRETIKATDPDLWVFGSPPDTLTNLAIRARLILDDLGEAA